MLKEKRLQMILEILGRDGEVQCNNLCKLFGVTDMTIRRDLDTLAKSNFIIRTHGGAVLNPSQKLKEPPYGSRLTEHIPSKEKLAIKALELISSGQRIFLDSGTTTLYLAQNLPSSFHNTVLTNGLNIGSELISHQNLSTIIIGGDLDPNTFATRGILAEKSLGEFRIDVAFLGCNAISPEGEVLVGNVTEIGLKKQAMKISQKIYLLVDSSKFNDYSLISYAFVSDFDGIITDDSLEPETKDKIERLGGRLFITSTNDSSPLP